LGEDEKAMFQVGDWPYEIILCYLAGPQCHLRKVEKATFSKPDKEGTSEWRTGSKKFRH
jgi:hypothetical protein